jgi:decaprenyl-phosphate phosphoribosyltransferase
MGEAGVLESVGLAFLSFCLMASCVYILNDLKDVEADRLHPQKRKRAIASGAVSPGRAIVVACILGLISLGTASFLSIDLLGVLFVYLFINFAYTYVLRAVAIVDITIIALGFLLRIFAGGVVADIPISHWLIVQTFLLALLLALGKRRAEFTNHGKEAMRASLSGYNLPFIDGAMVFLGAVTVVAYLMYTISPEVTSRIGSEYVYLTGFFVVLGILRYLQLAMVYSLTETPSRLLLKDSFLQVVLLGWGLLFGWLLYF